jgi:hypothetical protein
MQYQNERASADEQLVNEHMLGQCMHPNFRVVRSPSLLYAECRDCNAWRHLDGRPSREQAYQELLAQQIRPAHNPTNGLQVERLMGRAGWEVLSVCRDGVWRCTVKREGLTFESADHSTPAAAAVQVAALLIKKGLYKA